MKKIVSLILLSAMLALSLIACGGSAGFDYKANASKYVISLPDYEANKLAATIAQLAAVITDDDVKDEINKALESGNAYREKLTEGKINWGDTIGLTYKGVLASNVEKLMGETDTLEDFLTRITTEQIDGLSAFSGGETKTETTLVIGSGSFIDGFEAEMVGMELGKKNQSLIVTFPEDYKETTLAGKKAVFFVSPTYKIRLEAERDLAFGDQIALKYETKLDEKDAAYKDYFNDETKEAITKLITLSQDSQFHSALILAFNNARKPAEGSTDPKTAFGVELKFEENYNVSVPKTDENGEETGKEDKQVLVHHTVTVYSLAEPVYYTADEAADGTLAFKDFLSYLSLKEADYKDKTYADYFKETKDDLQKARTLQIKANRYQAAFDALVDASELNMDDPVIREVIQNYINEVNGNIDYMVTYYRASGYASLYESMLSYYNCKDLKEYVMYTMYGYKYDTIEAQLKTDAEEYVADRLVFWAFVEKKNVTLTDAEYNAKLDEYKKLYENDNFVSENNITEEALREAMLWDKVAGMLAGDFNADNTEWVDAYVTFTEKAVKSDKDDKSEDKDDDKKEDDKKDDTENKTENA